MFVRFENVHIYCHKFDKFKDKNHLVIRTIEYGRVWAPEVDIHTL